MNEHDTISSGVLTMGCIVFLSQWAICSEQSSPSRVTAHKTRERRYSDSPSGKPSPPPPATVTCPPGRAHRGYRRLPLAALPSHGTVVLAFRRVGTGHGRVLALQLMVSLRCLLRFSQPYIELICMLPCSSRVARGSHTRRAGMCNFFLSVLDF